MSPEQLDALAEAAQAGTRKADEAVRALFALGLQPRESWH